MSAVTRFKSRRLSSVFTTLLVTTCLTVPAFASQSSGDTNTDSTTDANSMTVEVEVEKDRDIVDNEDGSKTITSTR